MISLNFYRPGKKHIITKFLFGFYLFSLILSIILQPIVFSALAHDTIETPTPTPEPTPEQKGSITVCKIVSDNTINLGTKFEIDSIAPSTSSVDAPVGLFGNSIFTMPLAYNSDILSDVPGNDAECKTYGDLPLGGYHYGEEEIIGSGSWDITKYNDQFIHLIMTVLDFFDFDDNLYDGDPSNDNSRNQDSDGHILLIPERPDRTIVVYNQAPIAPTLTPTPSLNPTSTPTPTPNSTGSSTPTPTPTLTPTPTPDEGGVGGCPDCSEPTPTPTHTPSGGGGGISGGSSTGGGGSGGSGGGNTPTPTPNLTGSGAAPIATPAVLGSSIEILPGTSLTFLDRMIFSIFSATMMTGIMMLMIAHNRIPRKLKKHLR